MKKFLKITGIAVAALGVGLNLQYAFVDYYGIKDQKLSAQVWGQTVKTPYSDADATNGSTSNDGGGTNGSPVNTGTSADGEQLKWQKVTESRECTDVTASISYNSTSNGSTAGASVNLGPLGTWGVNTAGWGSNGQTGGVTSYKITFPKNSDGTAMKWTYTFCFPVTNGEKCHSVDPCLSAALSMLQSGMSSSAH